jgi:hypothetical protein
MLTIRNTALRTPLARELARYGKVTDGIIAKTR